MGWNRLLPFFRKRKKRGNACVGSRGERRDTSRVVQESICQWRLADRDAEPVSSLPAFSLSLGRLTSIPLVIRTSSIQPSTTTKQRGRREVLALLILDDNKSDKSIASSRYNLFNTHTLPCVQPLRRHSAVL
jgi:hypothetical protein